MTGFVVQKLHPALKLGQRLMLSRSKSPLFSAQGAWDGGCAVHSSAMALALLGRLAHPAYVSDRQNGPEAVFWHALNEFYLAGITLRELHDRLYELNWGLRPLLLEGTHRQVLAAIERELLKGNPVIVSWRESTSRALHAVLAVGLEGRVRGRRFEPHALLILDPSEREPWGGCNARLEYIGPALGKRTRRDAYVTADYTISVVLDNALSIRLAKASPTKADRPP